jgi:hypothetical protein
VGGGSRFAWCLCAVALLAACGGHDPHHAVRTTPATSTARVAPPVRAPIAPLGGESTHAPLLVYFKRVIGIDPLASELTVHQDGTGVALITFGGVGGQHRRGFRLSRSQYGRLRSLVVSARRTGLRETGCCADVNHYIYTVILAGRAVRWQQRTVPRADRQLIDLLNQLLDQRASQ